MRSRCNVDSGADFYIPLRFSGPFCNSNAKPSMLELISTPERCFGSPFCHYSSPEGRFGSPFCHFGEAFSSPKASLGTPEASTGTAFAPLGRPSSFLLPGPMF